MSDRVLKILAGVLAFFILAWLAARLLSNGDGEVAPIDLSSVAELELDSVVVTAPGGAVRLRHGDGWTVNGHEAMADAGESLDAALEGAEFGQLVSRNPDNHVRLGVTADSGRVLTFYAAGEPQLSLILGNQAEMFDRAYARRMDDNEVFTVRGTLVNLAKRSVDDWRNRVIISTVRGDVQRIEYAYGDTTFSLVREGEGWRVEPPGRSVAEGSVSPVLNNLAELRALGFAADSVADTLSWEAPTARLRVEGPGGGVIGELSFIEREENVGYFVRRADRPVVYTLSSFLGDQILKRRDELAPPSEELEPTAEDPPVRPPDG